MTAPTLAQPYTLTAYRALEEASEERHEYRNGGVALMPGGTLEHSQIAGNIYALLRIALKGTSFKPITSDLRIWIPQYRRGTYADIAAIEGPPQFNDNRRDEILNPKLIVEVLSPSTEAYDRGNKFLYYRSIPTFSEYLLVSQSRPFIDRYIKTTDTQWVLTSYEGLETTVTMASIPVELAMAGIYEDIAFAPKQDRE
ncbi:Uma2 family endonuclease [Synechococcus sp. PCC 7336]|uniref:Uma2 family endonuclease n=1 Tax=Synechococcus sp. PCC 7336 TaxID=195250 RepID=UPI00034AD03E|nr:Uma2 family endonuclease [Synechococcus sp. PCC 7336]